MRHIKQRKGDFMKCEECQEMLWDYLDKALSKEEALQLETHLNGCGDCQEELQDIKHIKETMHQIKQKELPKNYHETLMKRLEAEQEEANKIVPFGRTKKPQTWFKYSGLVAAALVLFAVGTGENLLSLKKDLDADVKQQTSQQQETEEKSFYMETATTEEGERFFVEDLNQLRSTIEVAEPTNNQAEDDMIGMEAISEAPQFEYLQAPLDMPNIPQSISAGGYASDRSSISNARPNAIENAMESYQLEDNLISIDTSMQTIQEQEIKEEYLGMAVAEIPMEQHGIEGDMTPSTYHFVPPVEREVVEGEVVEGEIVDSDVSKVPQSQEISTLESIASSENVMPIIDTPIPSQETEITSMQPRSMTNENKIESGTEIDSSMVVEEIPAEEMDLIANEIAMQQPMNFSLGMASEMEGTDEAQIDYLVEIDVANVEKACLIVQDYLMEEMPYANIHMIEKRKMRVIIEEKDRTECMKYLLEGMGGVVTQALPEDADEEICIDILFHTA